MENNHLKISETLQKIDESYDFFGSKEGFIEEMNNIIQHSESQNMKNLAKMMLEDVDDLFE